MLRTWKFRPAARLKLCAHNYKAAFGKSKKNAATVSLTGGGGITLTTAIYTSCTFVISPTMTTVMSSLNVPPSEEGRSNKTQTQESKSQRMEGQEAQTNNVWRNKRRRPSTYGETKDANHQRMERPETQTKNVWSGEKSPLLNNESPTERDLRLGLRTLGPPKKPKQAPENKEALDTLSRIPNSSQTHQ